MSSIYIIEKFKLVVPINEKVAYTSGHQQVSVDCEKIFIRKKRCQVYHIQSIAKNMVKINNWTPLAIPHRKEQICLPKPKVISNLLLIVPTNIMHLFVSLVIRWLPLYLNQVALRSLTLSNRTLKILSNLNQMPYFILFQNRRHNRIS